MVIKALQAMAVKNLCNKGRTCLRFINKSCNRRFSSQATNDEDDRFEISTPLSQALPNSPIAQYNKPHDENHNTFVTTFDSGMKVASQPGFGTFCTVGILVNAGSRHEAIYPSGVSHFLERLAFSGSENHGSRDEVMQEVEKMGGICDCQTSRDTTIYAASVSSENVEALMKLLGETVFKPTYPEHEITQATENIKFELQDMETRPDPEPLMTELIHEAAFRGNTIGLPRYPTSKQISLINCETIHEFLRSHYTPNRVTVAGVGIEHDKFIQLSKKYIERPAKDPSWPLIGVSQTDNSLAQYTGGEAIVQKTFDLSMSVVPLPELAHVSIGLESASFTDDDFVPFAVLNMLMGGGGSFSAGGPGKGMFSRLYLNVLNRHHWMYAATAFHHSYHDGGLFCIQASSHPSQIRDSVNVITQEFTRLTDGTNKEELERAKCQLKSMLMMNLESRPVIFEDIGRQVLATGTRKSPIELCEIIQSVTELDIKRVANRMLNSNVSVAALGDVSKMPSLSDIQSALNRKDGRLPRSFKIFGR